MLEWAEYILDTETLEAGFHSGAVYAYAGVPEDEYEALLAAPSHGAYFNENIRDRYSAVRLR
jgi:hypothetical protein